MCGYRRFIFLVLSRFRQPLCRTLAAYSLMRSASRRRSWKTSSCAGVNTGNPREARRSTPRRHILRTSCAVIPTGSPFTRKCMSGLLLAKRTASSSALIEFGYVISTSSRQATPTTGVFSSRSISQVRTKKETPSYTKHEGVDQAREGYGTATAASADMIATSASSMALASVTALRESRQRPTRPSPFARSASSYSSPPLPMKT